MYRDIRNHRGDIGNIKNEKLGTACPAFPPIRLGPYPRSWGCGSAANNVSARVGTTIARQALGQHNRRCCACAISRERLLSVRVNSQTPFQFVPIRRNWRFASLQRHKLGSVHDKQRSQIRLCPSVAVAMKNERKTIPLCLQHKTIMRTASG